MTFLDIQKEYAQKYGMLQNGSITGMNADMQDLMKKDINREMKELADMHPPWFGVEKRIYLVASTILKSGTTNSATGTASIPRIIDTASRLKDRDVFCTLGNGTWFHRVIGVSGTTYDTSQPLLTSATTGTAITAYRDVYPLPHDMGDVSHLYYEDGEIPIAITNSMDQFQKLSVRSDNSSLPRVAGIDVFTNEWYDYKYRDTAVTVTSGSRQLVGISANSFDIGDVCTLTSGTTVALHTIVGRDTTNNIAFLDRNYGGSTASVIIEVNPKQYTHYVSFYRLPTASDEIKMVGWRKPQDMVYDTDVCEFPSHLIPLIVIGALMRSKFSMEILSEQWVTYYNDTIKELRKKKKANWDRVTSPPNWTGYDALNYPTYTVRT
jgi:hypothetical protein